MAGRRSIQLMVVEERFCFILIFLKIFGLCYDLEATALCSISVGEHNRVAGWAGYNAVAVI